MKHDKIKNYTEYKDFPCHYERLIWIYQILESSAKENKIKVLDVGCGTGNVTIPLGLIDNAIIDGIDVHEGNLDVSRSRNTFENVQFGFKYFQEHDIKTYDYIIFTEVLEHIPNYHEIFSHAKNMKPKAKLLVTIPNGYGPFEWAMTPLYIMRKWGMNDFIWKVKRLLGKKEPYSQNYDTPHVNFFTIKRLERELANYGMKIDSVKNAYILSPIIETYLPFIPLDFISKIDNSLAQILPNFLASGWYLIISKNN